MNPIDRLGVIAARTQCPACAAPTLELRLRCDIDKGPCLTTAQCESCQTTFVIDGETTANAEPAVPCAQCGSAQHTMKLQCDVASHQCVEVAVCAPCQAVTVTPR